MTDKTDRWEALEELVRVELMLQERRHAMAPEHIADVQMRIAEARAMYDRALYEVAS